MKIDKWSLQETLAVTIALLKLLKMLSEKDPLPQSQKKIQFVIRQTFEFLRSHKEPWLTVCIHICYL